MSTTIRPRLIVTSVDDAVAFYVTVLGAEETFRFTEPSGSVAHCELIIGTSPLSLAQANDEYRLHAPTGEGSPVLLTAIVDDASAVGAAMTAAGATVVVPIEDRDYGRREGRIRDPFGHLWVISQPL